MLPAQPRPSLQGHSREDSLLSRFNGTIQATWGSLGRSLHRYVPSYFPISYKLALVFTLLIAAGMVALGIVVLRNQTSLLERQMNDLGVTVTRQMAEAAKEQLLADDALGLQALANNLLSDNIILGAGVYSDDALPVITAGAVPPDELLHALAGHGRPFEWIGPDRDGELVALASFLTPVMFRDDVMVGYALVTFDRSFMEHAQLQTLRAVTGATLLLILVAIGTSILLGKRLTRPIYQLMAASRAISEGDYQFRFDERRNDELGALMMSMNTMTEGLLRKEQVEKTFSRYVSPGVAKEVLSRLEEVHLGGLHVEATVLFADIVGFTSMSENMHPEEVGQLLNEYFSYIADAAHAFGGHVDKYIGDCAMLVFGVPEFDEDHMFRGVACAVLVQHLIEAMNHRRGSQGKEPVRFRVGINSGMMMAGNMGSRDRMEYTVVGDAVNLASRLANVAEPDEIVITEEMHNDPRLIGRIITQQLGTIRLRGKKNPVGTYLVKDVADDYRGALATKAASILNHPES